MKVGRSRYCRTDWIILHCSDPGCPVFWLGHCRGKLGVEFLELGWGGPGHTCFCMRLLPKMMPAKALSGFWRGSGLNLWVKRAMSRGVNMLWALKWESKNLNIILSFLSCPAGIETVKLRQVSAEIKFQIKNHIASVCKALLLKETMNRDFWDHRVEVRYPKSHLF